MRTVTTATMLRAEEPFGLVQDMRQVRWWAAGLSGHARLVPSMLDELRAVAAGGMLQRVAFVTTCNPSGLGARILNGVLRLSPVQPTRAFMDFDEAVRWCGDHQSTTAGAGAGASPRAAGHTLLRPGGHPIPLLGDLVRIPAASATKVVE
jgi:hypothetical protein